MAELKVRRRKDGTWFYHLIPPSKKAKGEALMAKVMWVEIWTDMASGGLDLLLLRGFSNGRIELRDPHQNNKLVQTFTSYDDAEFYLTDDEYVVIEGRLETDAHDFAQD